MVMSENAPAQKASSAERTPSFTTPVRRRNGELQACEPCRKRKLKCDHGFPTCGRCVKRSGVDKCVYHPAPLTKTNSAPSHRSSKSETTSQTGLPTPSSPPLSSVLETRSIDKPSQSSASPGSIKKAPSNATEPTFSLNAPPSDPLNMGFLGRSSYNSVVAEINASLGVSPQENREISQPEPIADEKIRRGAEVLSYLKDYALFSQLIERWLNIAGGFLMFSPIYRIWMDGIRLFFGISGYDVGLNEDLLELSKLISRNTQQPHKADASMTARQWAIHSTGDKLRWETLGLIFSTVGICCGFIHRWDPIFLGIHGQFKDRFTLLKSTLGLVDGCIALSRACGEPNEIMVTLLYESVILIQRIKGETSFAAWRRMSEVCDYSIALGLHQEKRNDQKTPFFLRELRVRLYSQTYSYDKFMSTHLGRPPRLTYRHSVLQVPMDLSDEEVCYEEPMLSRTIQDNLDENGWNKPGRRLRVSWRIAIQAMLPVREDILELAIGSSGENFYDRIEDIRHRIESICSTWPPFLLADADEFMAQIRSQNNFTPHGSSQEWGQIDTISFLTVNASLRHTDFLLERAIVHRKKTSTEALIVAARRLLKMILQSISLKNILPDYESDMAVMLALYGVPCAGVLGIELLKQDQARDHLPYTLPRSEIIQQLSVLISALGTVHPDEGGNFAIATQGMTALQGLLDKILSPKPAAAENPGMDGQTLMHSFPPDFATNNDADFVQWLNNVEWQGDNWMENLGVFGPGGENVY